MGKRVAWGVWGVILLVLIGLVCFQIYRVATGKVASYGYTPHENPSPAAQQGRKFDVDKDLATSGLKLADTEQVKTLANYEYVTPQSLKGDAQAVTFRNQSGSIVCTMMEKIQDMNKDGWVVPFNHPGLPLPSGNGVVCSTTLPIPLNSDDIGGRCDSGDLVGDSFAAWTKDVGAGTCQSERSKLLQNAGQYKSINEELPGIGLYQRVRIGKYACGDAGASLTCLNLETGKGFNIGADSYVLLK